MEEIDLFVKILSQGRRKEEEEEFQSVEVPEQAPLHLKTGKGPNILANSVQNSNNLVLLRNSIISSKVYNPNVIRH